jgi:predicted aldo/keto reductase-like oxidoreductase
MLPTTTLGRTGLTVTRLGIGGAYCLTPEGYRTALDCGVNYVDAARAYRDGKDEEVIGQALVGRRQNIILGTKTMQRGAQGARGELEYSLKILRTDYVDIWSMHAINSAAERIQIFQPGGAYDAALKAKEDGLIRFIGVTGHNWEEVGKCVETGLFDTCLCWYNCAFKQAETLVFPAAQAHGTGVLIMNATRNDKLFGPEMPSVEDFYRYVLMHPDVDMVLMGLRNVELFQQVAHGLSQRTRIDTKDIQQLEEYGAKMLSEGKLVM